MPLACKHARPFEPRTHALDSIESILGCLFHIRCSELSTMIPLRMSLILKIYFLAIFDHFLPFLTGFFLPFFTIFRIPVPYQYSALKSFDNDPDEDVIDPENIFFDNFWQFLTIFDHFWPLFYFYFFLFRIFSGRFDISGCMIPRLVPEISPLDAFCDEQQQE